MTPAADTRPLPLLTAENRAFWTGGERGQLLIHRCADCACWIHPPTPICGRCRSRSVRPQPVSGLGLVASYTVNLQPWRPGQTVPYVVAIVELDEQSALRLTTNIVGCPAESVRIGQRVKARFEQHEDVWLPLFAPVV